MPQIVGRQTECDHRRCGRTGRNIARHETEDRRFTERVCDAHVETHEEDPTFAGWVDLWSTANETDQRLAREGRL